MGKHSIDTHGFALWYTKLNNLYYMEELEMRNKLKNWCNLGKQSKMILKYAHDISNPKTLNLDTSSPMKGGSNHFLLQLNQPFNM